MGYRSRAEHDCVMDSQRHILNLERQIAKTIEAADRVRIDLEIAC